MNKKFTELFLESEYSSSKPENALFHIIPAPLEESVSYGTGTAAGPDAVIKASSQLEIWDGKSVPGSKGIYTSRWIGKEKITTAGQFLDNLEAEVMKTLDAGSIPVILGGEHTVSLSAFRAMHRRKINAGIVQFDAHADLREEYRGNRLSHACVMRRAYELGFPFFQAGVRSLSPAEVQFRKEAEILFLDAADAVPENICKIDLPKSFPEKIYITIDVDGFDPSVFPGTGTPEPGGLGWYQVLKMIESISVSREIIGFDVVEVAPQPGSHVSEFAAARLVYNVMGIISRSRKQAR